MGSFVIRLPSAVVAERAASSGTPGSIQSAFITHLMWHLSAWLPKLRASRRPRAKRNKGLGKRSGLRSYPIHTRQVSKEIGGKIAANHEGYVVQDQSHGALLAQRKPRAYAGAQRRLSRRNTRPSCSSNIIQSTNPHKRLSKKCRSLSKKRHSRRLPVLATRDLKNSWQNRPSSKIAR